MDTTYEKISTYLSSRLESLKVKTDLTMTAQDGFQLSHIEDLENYKSQLISLKSINISDNLITNLILRDFPKITIIKASKNMISEVNLNLNNLIELEMPHNMVIRLFDLTNLPKLQILNLEYNLIKNVNAESFLPVKKSLKDLKLAYNKITFTSNELITFAEGLRSTHIQLLTVKGNPFTVDEKTREFYKLLFVSIVKSLTFLDSDEIKLKREKLDQNEIINYIFSNGGHAKESKKNSTSENKAENSIRSLKNRLSIIEDKCIQLNEMNGENQQIYLELLAEINQCLNQTDDYWVKCRLINYLSKLEYKFQEFIKKNEKNENKVQLESLHGKKYFYYFTKISEKLKILRELTDQENNNKNTSDKINLNSVNVRSIENFGERLKLTESQKKMERTEFYVKEIIEYKEKISKLKEELREDKDKYYEEIQEKYAVIIMNFFLLMEIKPILYEVSLYKIIASFSLISNGETFADKSFSFFNSLAQRGTNRVEKILKVFREVIIPYFINLKGKPPHKLLNPVVEFYKERPEGEELYNCLILSANENLENKSKNFSLEKSNFSELKTILDIINQYLTFQSNRVTIEDCFETQTSYTTEGNNLSFNQEDILSDEEEKSEEDSQFEDRSIFSKTTNNFSVQNEENSFSDDSTKNPTINNKKDNKKRTNNFYLTSTSLVNKQDGSNDFNLKIISSSLEALNLILEKIFISVDKHQKTYEPYKDIFKEDNDYEQRLAVLKQIFDVLLTITIFFKNQNINEMKGNLPIGKIKYSKFKKDNKISESIKEISKKINIFLKEFLQDYKEDAMDNYNKKKFNQKIKHTVYNEKLDQKKNKEREEILKQTIEQVFNVHGALIFSFSDKEIFEDKEKENKKDFNIFKSISNILTLKQNDPYILKGACDFTYYLINSSYLKNNNMLYSSFLNSYMNFTRVLNYIDKSHPSYQMIYNTLYEQLGQKNFEELKKPEHSKLIDIIQSILILLKSVSNAALANTPESANEVSKELTKKDCLLFLSNCLKINEDKIRKLVVECFYYHNYEDLINYLPDILKIIKDYSSITEGETEVILSTIYFILSEILLASHSETENFVLEATKCALNFLKKNLNRSVVTSEENEERNLLSTSLILFLNVASNKNNSKQFKNLLSSENLKQTLEDFRQIFIYQEMNSFSSEPYIPIEIERTLFGNYLRILTEIRRNETHLNPYSPPYCRLMIKIADLLCNSKEFTYYADYSNDIEKLSHILGAQIRSRVMFRFLNEKLTWYEFYPDLLNFIQNDYKNIEKKKEMFNKKKDTSNLIKSGLLDYNDSFINVENLKSKIFKQYFSNDILKDIEEDSQRINEKLKKYPNTANYNFQAPLSFKKTSNFMINNLVEQISPDLKKNNQPTNLYTNKEENSKSTQKKLVREIDEDSNFYISEYLPKLDLQEFIEEQINFVYNFNNFLLYIFGMTSSIADPEITKAIYIKADKKIVSSESIVRAILSSSHDIITEEDYSAKKDVIENKDEHTLKYYMGIVDKHKLLLSNIKHESVSFSEKCLQDIEISTNYLEQETRHKNEESVHNADLRSLLASAMMRSVYSILISPVSEVVHKFMDVLFCLETWNLFVIFIDTTKLFDFEIASKALILYQALFDKKNLLAMLRSHRSRNEDQISSSDKKFELNSTEKQKLLHTYYISFLFLNKIFEKSNERFFKQDHFNFIYIRDLNMAYYSFISSMNNLPFASEYESFISEKILSVLIKEDFIENVYYCIISTRLLTSKAITKIHEIGLEEICDDRLKTSFSKTDYLISYIGFLQETTASLYTLLGMASILYPKCHAYIINLLSSSKKEIEKPLEEEITRKVKISELNNILLNCNDFEDYIQYIKQEKLIHFETPTTTDDDTGTQEINNESEIKLFAYKMHNLNKNKKQRKSMINKFLYSRKQIDARKKLKNLIEDLKSSWEELIFINDNCLFNQISDNKFYEGEYSYFVLTNKKIYILPNKIEKKTNDENVENFQIFYIGGEESWYQLFNSKKETKKFSLKDIQSISYYDYLNRLVFKTKSGEDFSIVMYSIKYSKKICDYISSFNVDTEIHYLQMLSESINKIESKDSYALEVMKNSLHSQHNDKKEMDENTKKENEAKIAKEKEDFMREFTMKNNIYTSIYKMNRTSQHEINTLLVVDSLFKDSLEEHFLKEKAILYISKAYLYVMTDNFHYVREQTKLFEEKNLNLKNKIKLELLVEISNVNSLSVEVKYYSDTKKTKMDKIYFSFFSSYEKILFKYLLYARIIKNIYDVEKKKFDFREKGQTLK